MINKTKSFLLIKDDFIFSVDLTLTNFGSKYRVLVRDSVSNEILFSKLFDSEEEALDQFNELEVTLSNITSYLKENKLEEARRYSKRFFDLLPHFDRDFVENIEESEEVSLPAKASFVGTYIVAGKENSIFDVYKEEDKYFGVFSNSKDRNLRGKVLKFPTFEKMIDYINEIENDQ